MYFYAFLGLVLMRSQFTLAWSYTDESNWPGDKCQRGGKRQSPIDIQTANVVWDYREEFIQYGVLKFTGYSQVLMSAVNNGHTIQYTSDGEQSIHPLVTGGPLKHLYRLEQLHFHWFSEHAVNGIKFPMEIHLVHVRVDLTVADALLEKDGLAILAIFCNVLPALEHEQEDTLSELMEKVPAAVKPGTRVSGVILNLTQLFKFDVNSYYTYSGSLTSPECYESVIWIIFDTCLNITQTQYNQFGEVGVGKYNFRSLQHTDRHVVYRPVTSQVETPYLVSVLRDVGHAVVDFFKRLSGYFQKGIYRRTLKVEKLLEMNHKLSP